LKTHNLKIYSNVFYNLYWIFVDEQAQDKIEILIFRILRMMKYLELHLKWQEIFFSFYIIFIDILFTTAA
jgi:hypothetical protein